jgi:hypothetical protein
MVRSSFIEGQCDGYNAKKERSRAWRHRSLIFVSRIAGTGFCRFVRRLLDLSGEEFPMYPSWRTVAGHVATSLVTLVLVLVLFGDKLVTHRPTVLAKAREHGTATSSLPPTRRITSMSMHLSTRAS